MSIERNMNTDQHRFIRNRNRLDRHNNKDNCATNNSRRLSDYSIFGPNDDFSQTSDDDMINNINYPNVHQLFIGNLSWRTTDQDIMNSIIDVGVRDFVDIQFFVNRENGQSKVCTVTLESEQSLQRILKKIPKKIIHGQKPVVKYPYSQTLFMYKSEFKTQPSSSSIYQNLSSTSMGNMSSISDYQLVQNPPLGMPYYNNMPLMSGYIKTHQQYLHTVSYEKQWNKSCQQMGPQESRYQCRGQLQKLITPEQGLIGAGDSHDEWNRFSSLKSDQLCLQTQDNSIRLGQRKQSYHCQVSNNPFDFNETTAPTTPQSFPDTVYPIYTNSYDPRKTNKIEMTETEINNIINRNRIVSSSAIARAITNVNDGENANAIETLSTAIALIKDSKMANHESSKILICSLYDTIFGIETKIVNKKKEMSRSPSNKLYSRSKSKHRQSYEYGYRCRSYNRSKNRYRDQKYGRDEDKELSYEKILANNFKSNRYRYKNSTKSSSRHSKH